MTTATAASSMAMWFSLLSNIILTLLKLIVGFLTNSQVLMADGIHNAGDVIATAAAFSSMRISQKPADQEHPYGHGKAEVLASGSVAIILGIAAIYIAFESIVALFEEPAPASYISLTAAIISLVWKQWLYVYTYRIGKKQNSKGLIATAYDHLADVYASIAAVIGIGLALVGDAYHIPYFAYGDAVAGLVVSILVLKLVIHMGKEAVDILMEKNLDQEQIDRFAELIRSIPEVKRIDRLRAREHGHYILVDARVSIPGEYTIQQGHDISREIKRVIMEKYNEVDEVLVHLNPWYEEDET
ncbi:cation diffusion facilitator family transporter [Brevibacillus fulvus]|uniref:Cation diffusion facilitator family transporter n=1 Tax=Brevibacillus fulvus TaxID=1125967 RepID=A0A939BNN7_9BACL|nr:cation diffusion facilitator family transporter [Brevibacillus fulvus]MBM7589365.1 cation diffusion facilitator family transporter [Brevibacillus fulvus]